MKLQMENNISPSKTPNTQEISPNQQLKQNLLTSSNSLLPISFAFIIALAKRHFLGK